MKTILRIIVALSVISFFVFSCDILPMSEVKYYYDISGPPDYFYEGFEENDDVFSVRYFYERSGSPKPSISSIYGRASDHSAEFSESSTLSVTIEFPEAGILTFWMIEVDEFDDHYETPEYFNLLIDEEIADPSVVSSTDDGWYQFSIDVPAGIHTLTWQSCLSGLVSWAPDFFFLMISVSRDSWRMPFPRVRYLLYDGSLI